MSETNDSVENTAGNRKTGLNKYRKTIQEKEPDAIASAD
jgi:hypothetical protein